MEVIIEQVILLAVIVISLSCHECCHGLAAYRDVYKRQVSGLDCRVVETEDEFGVLKLWISKTLGLPIKYLGTYDSGWYGLTLSNIQTGHADESLFAIPGDILIVNDGVSQTYDEIISGVSDEINAGQQ